MAAHAIMIKHPPNLLIINLLHAIVQICMKVSLIQVNHIHNNCFHLLGDLCERPYNGCRSDSACRVNWQSNTTCTPKSVDKQESSNRPYTCLGTCVDGYDSTDNFTCNGRYSRVCKSELLYQSNRRHQ